MTDNERGAIVDDDGHTVTLTFRRILRHTPEHVWEALSTPAGLEGWLMCTHANIEPRAGGDFELVSGPAGYHSTGKIRHWDPPHVLEYEWKVAAVSEMPLGQDAIFRFELVPQPDNTTLLVVTYRRITKDTAGGFLPGTHVFLDRLEAQLAGTPLPDWMTRFIAIRDTYPEWKDHATTARQ